MRECGGGEGGGDGDRCSACGGVGDPRGVSVVDGGMPKPHSHAHTSDCSAFFGIMTLTTAPRDSGGTLALTHNHHPVLSLTDDQEVVTIPFSDRHTADPRGALGSHGTGAMVVLVLCASW